MLHCSSPPRFTRSNKVDAAVTTPQKNKLPPEHAAPSTIKKDTPPAKAEQTEQKKEIAVHKAYAPEMRIPSGPATKPGKQPEFEYYQKGNASYYANKFHGRKTANGERYNKYELTAAHPKLPFNSIVKVTNTRNNQSVIVRINDRGPFIKGRIIDISRAAAVQLGMLHNGIAEVIVETIKM